MRSTDVLVTNKSYAIVVLSSPEARLRRTWQAHGQSLPIDKEELLRAMYEPGVMELFRSGTLFCDDHDVLANAGLLDENDQSVVIETDAKLYGRMIKVMPLNEFKNYLSKMSSYQIAELADYAITHYTELDLGRVDILSQVSSKNILKAIDLYKASTEG